MACNLDEVIQNNLDSAIEIFMGDKGIFTRYENTLVANAGVDFSFKKILVEAEIGEKNVQKWIDNKFSKNEKFTSNWMQVTKGTAGIEIKFRIPPLLKKAWQYKIERLEAEEQAEIEREIQQEEHELSARERVEKEKELGIENNSESISLDDIFYFSDNTATQSQAVPVSLPELPKVKIKC